VSAKTAASPAIKRASKTLRDLRVAEVSARWDESAEGQPSAHNRCKPGRCRWTARQWVRFEPINRRCIHCRQKASRSGLGTSVQFGFACCDTTADPCFARLDSCAILSTIGPAAPVIG